MQTPQARQTQQGHPFVSLTLAVAALAGLAGSAQAQDYPNRPVRIVVAFTAGGTTDILARSVGQHLSERFKQPFVIDNKPGAGGNLGTEMVVRSAPDGYTLIVASVGPIAVNPTLFKSLSYNPLTDLVPIVQIADVPNVLVVHPSLPVKTVEELIGHAKAHPDKLNYSSTGVGTSSHLSGFMFCRRAGIDRDARSLQGRRSAEGPSGGPRAVHVCHHSIGHAAHSGRQAAGHGRKQREALALIARGADRGRERFP